MQSTLKMTLAHAAIEFALDRKTLSKRLSLAGAKPDEQGLWTILKCATAIYSDASSQRTRLLKEQADRVAMSNADSRGEYLPRLWLRSVLADLSAGIRQVIEHSPLSRAEQAAIFANLRKLCEQEFEGKTHRQNHEG